MADKKHCGAKTRAGTPCQIRPMKNGTGRCRLHGGLSLRGIESATYKGAGRSKFMPKDLLNRWSDAMDDPNLTDLRQDIALEEAFLHDKLEELQIGPAPTETIREARRIFLTMADIFSGKGGESAIDRLPDLADEGVAVTQPGVRRAKVLGEIQDGMQRRKKLIDSKNAADLRGANAIPITELMLFLSNVVQLIDKIVDNRDDQRALKTGIQNLIIAES